MAAKSVEKAQVTVRLSADVVAHIDHLVESGLVVSRAAYLDGAARRQQQLELAERDAQLLIGAEPDPDTAEILSWMRSRTHPELD
jgi:Arc/MetJ-type ribon-helix-helix transcriptional regulator